MTNEGMYSIPNPGDLTSEQLALWQAQLAWMALVAVQPPLNPLPPTPPIPPQ